MTRREFESWAEFYRLFPFDDRHRFHRPAALIALRAGGGDGEKLRSLLGWLSPDPIGDEYSEADLNTFRAFGFKPPGRG